MHDAASLNSRAASVKYVINLLFKVSFDVSSFPKQFVNRGQTQRRREREGKMAERQIMYIYYICIYRTG